MTAITNIGRAKLVSLSVAVVAVLVAGAISIAIGGAGSSKAVQPKTVTASSAHRKPAPVDHALLSVRGVTGGRLSPGATEPVTVYVHNAGHQNETVVSTTITVQDASEGCTAARNIRVTGYHRSANSSSYIIKAHHTVTVPLTITMLDLHDSGTVGGAHYVSGNQDACQSSRFPLTFHATAKIG